MAGTIEGGVKAAQSNRERHGEDYYKIIGSKGGSVKGVMKGFALSRERASAAGRKGGSVSRRRPTNENQDA